MKIMSSIYKQKIYIHKVSSQFQSSYRLFYANRKISELILDVRVYRGNYICSDHFLILAKLVVTPKWLHLTKNSARKENQTSLSN